MTVALVLASVALAIAITAAVGVVVLARQSGQTLTTLRQHLLGHDAAHTLTHQRLNPQVTEHPDRLPDPDTGPIAVTGTDQPPTAAMRTPGRHAGPGTPPRPRPEERRP